ncbi:hypothetical protein B0H10DRAFT_1943538 [Mycena sp. CBHHK59/15]|nr:hypothetical protein B0H10DRAFT_1943538 [Mycena sp. CBHHK59/15]
MFKDGHGYGSTRRVCGSGWVGTGLGLQPSATRGNPYPTREPAGYNRPGVSGPLAEIHAVIHTDQRRPHTHTQHVFVFPLPAQSSPHPTGSFYEDLLRVAHLAHKGEANRIPASTVAGQQRGELIQICDCPEYKIAPVFCSQNMAPSSVISRSASAVCRGARKLKKEVSNIIQSISSGRSRKSKSAASVVSEKAAESEAGALIY